MGAEIAGNVAPTLTVFNAREAFQKAKDLLQPFGGADLLGYILSCGPWLDEEKALTLYARRLEEFVAARAQLREAERIAQWNARASTPHPLSVLEEPK
jgi:hypothetical protein